LFLSLNIMLFKINVDNNVFNCYIYINVSIHSIDELGCFQFGVCVCVSTISQSFCEYSCTNLLVNMYEFLWSIYLEWNCWVLDMYMFNVLR
jgi:hypothetical protein